jgi:hypothetical protein
MLLLSILVLAWLVISVPLFAQTQSKGDTLIIGPLNSQGQPLGALNEAIKADKKADGTRGHKVYKLLPNAQYILTEVIQVDFPLVLVADKPTNANRPPIIRGGLKEDGSAVNLWWQIYDHATFKNLWITGVNMDGTGPINWISQEVNTKGKTIIYDGCIVEYPYTWWAMFADWGGPNNYKILNSTFTNIGNPTAAMWNGAIFHAMRIDSAIFRNSTFFNFGCFAVNGGTATFYTEVDHCTFVNSMVHPVNSHRHIKQIYTNNLFLNCHAMSDDNDEIARHYDQEVKGLMNYAEIQWSPQELDSLYGPAGVYGKDKKYDPNGDGKLTDNELVWTLKNNVWYYTKPVTDYWAKYKNVMPNPWMNNYNKAMFASSNKTAPWTFKLRTLIWADSAGNKITNPKDFKGLKIVDSTSTTVTHQPFKYFIEQNTMNVDPGIIDMNGCDVSLAQNCDNIRLEWAGKTFTAVKWHNVADYLAFTWPLDFNLAYTNTTLKTAGTDGKPVGSLQWWPGMIYTPSAVQRLNSAKPETFEMAQNYPNPFNPTTYISYSVPAAEHVTIKVFNLLGTEVATLVDQKQTPGNYRLTFDAKRYSSGVYFYQLRAGKQTITHKMTIMK